MQAVVVAPKGATGKRPLALFLHGRHYTCYKPGTDDITGDWPCPAGTEAVPELPRLPAATSNSSPRRAM
jgi:hypothetical protein